MACAIIGKVVERGTDRMVNRNLNDGLPAFLVSNPGLNSGFMIPQYTAAGLMNEIKHLAIPATIDSIPTCAGQEDPVSMSYNAARRACQAVRKLDYVIAIEIMVALQAIDMLPEKQSPVTARLHDQVRQQVAYAKEDRFFQPDIEALFQMVRSGELVNTAEAQLGRSMM